MSRPLSWWLLLIGFLLVAARLWELSILEHAGLVALVLAGAAFLDAVADDLREKRRERESERRANLWRDDPYDREDER